MAEYMPILDTSSSAESSSSTKKGEEKSYKKKKKKALKAGGRVGLAGAELGGERKKPTSEKHSNEDFGKLLAEMGLKKEVIAEADAEGRATKKRSKRRSGRAARRAVATGSDAAGANEPGSKPEQSTAEEAALATVIPLEAARKRKNEQIPEATIATDQTSPEAAQPEPLAADNEVVIKLRPQKQPAAESLAREQPEGLAAVIPITRARSYNQSKDAAETAAADTTAEDVQAASADGAMSHETGIASETLESGAIQSQETSGQAAAAGVQNEINAADAVDSVSSRQPSSTSAAAAAASAGQAANASYGRLGNARNNMGSAGFGARGGSNSRNSRAGSGSGNGGGPGGDMSNPVLAQTFNILAAPQVASANQVAQAFNQGRGRGLLTGLLIGAGVEHIRHKRREKRQHKQTEQRQKKYERQIEDARFSQSELQQQHDTLKQEHRRLHTEAERQLSDRRTQVTPPVGGALPERPQDNTIQAARSEAAFFAPDQGYSESSTPNRFTAGTVEQPRILQSAHAAFENPFAGTVGTPRANANVLPRSASPEAYGAARKAAEKVAAPAMAAEVATQIDNEQLRVAEGHRLERSAWHTVEVDAHTGNIADQSSIEYGQEYYKERSHEVDESQDNNPKNDNAAAGASKKAAQPGNVALSALTGARAGQSVMQAGPASGYTAQGGAVSPTGGLASIGLPGDDTAYANSAGSNGQNTSMSSGGQPSKSGGLSSGMGQQSVTVASTVGWGVVLVVLVIIIIILA